MDDDFIIEGLVKINVPKFEKISSQAPVFYNPNMELNRDLSILVLQEYIDYREKKICICDAFSGSGIRGIRYSKELTNIDKIVVNDINPIATEYQNKNIELNNITNIEISQTDANLVLRENRGKFDIVDIDPFGTPSYFVDSVGYSIKSDSLLCISATDTSSLCGTYKSPCIRKYNAVPLKTEYCHENGIRILIGFVAMTFAKHKKYVEVKFSHSTEHYMRAYLIINKNAKKSDDSLKNMGHIVHCNNCLMRETIKVLGKPIPKVCPECGSKFDVCGPLWLGDIQDKDYIQSMINKCDEKDLNMKNKVLSLLNTCLDEVGLPATFYDIHKICKKLKISAPKLELIIDELEKEGFDVSKTHYKPVSIKTTANINDIKNIMKKL